MKDARLQSGKVYDGVRFTGGSSTRGVLHIDYSLQDVTIRNFIIEAGPQNGLTINCASGVSVSNVRFENFIIRSQPRMGIECTDRRTNAVYQHVDLIDGVLNPQGSEAISYDSTAKLPANCVLRNVTVQGAGINPSEQWGAGYR